MERLFLWLTLALACLSAVVGLECFLCDEEDWNHRDCTRRREQCNPFQDTCTTYIRYGVPEQFNARNYRHYFISKGCDTMTGCAKRQASTSSACSKSYYNDWSCVECCTGDLCNHEVHHLAGANIKANVVLTLGAVATAAILYLR